MKMNLGQKACIKSPLDKKLAPKSELDVTKTRLTGDIKALHSEIHQKESLRPKKISRSDKIFKKKLIEKIIAEIAESCPQRLRKMDIKNISKHIIDTGFRSLKEALEQGYYIDFDNMQIIHQQTLPRINERRNNFEDEIKFYEIERALGMEVIMKSGEYSPKRRQKKTVKPIEPNVIMTRTKQTKLRSLTSELLSKENANEEVSKKESGNGRKLSADSSESINDSLYFDLNYKNEKSSQENYLLSADETAPAVSNIVEEAKQNVPSETSEANGINEKKGKKKLKKIAEKKQDDSNMALPQEKKPPSFFLKENKEELNNYIHNMEDETSTLAETPGKQCIKAQKPEDDEIIIISSDSEDPGIGNVWRLKKIKISDELYMFAPRELGKPISYLNTDSKRKKQGKNAVAVNKYEPGEGKNKEEDYFYEISETTSKTRKLNRNTLFFRKFLNCQNRQYPEKIEASRSSNHLKLVSAKSRKPAEVSRRNASAVCLGPQVIRTSNRFQKPSSSEMKVEKTSSYKRGKEGKTAEELKNQELIAMSRKMKIKRKWNVFSN